MARAGLGGGWQCTFANDFDPMKAATYLANWGADHFQLADINALATTDLPGWVDLAWASFPCQDLSLAGKAAGLGTVQDQTRSGAFWAFWRLMEGLIAENRAPSFIVLENVYGSLTANGGRDFATIARCLSLGGYRFGALLIDAARFVPQSRPRIFIVAVRASMDIPVKLLAQGPMAPFHPPAMSNAIARLADVDRDNWLWFNPQMPLSVVPDLEAMIEYDPRDVTWHSAVETDRLVSMMSAPSLQRLRTMANASSCRVGTIYRRTRIEGGARKQRAELRDDGLAGCLRTPGGGSSRQTVIFVDGNSVRSRLMSSREAARLMGLPDSYKLPSRYNDAYHVTGDGVVVPVVRFLAETVIEPVAILNGYAAPLSAAG